MFAPPSTGPLDAVREKREFWEILFAAVAEQMAEGVSADDLPDVLLNSEQFKKDFLDRMDRRNWEEDEMWILLRRVATYTVTGR